MTGGREHSHSAKNSCISGETNGRNSPAAGVGSVEQCFEIEAATSLKVCGVGLPAPVCSRGKAAQAIVPFASRNVQRLITPLRRRDKVAHLILFSLQQIALQGCFRVRVFEPSEIAAEFDLQRRRTAWKIKFLQLGDAPAEDRQSLLPFSFRQRRRRLVVRPLDQLTGG